MRRSTWARWEHAVSATAGLLTRPVLLPCSAPGCTELVRNRARFCATHGRKWKERRHAVRAERERTRRGLGTTAAQENGAWLGAEADPYRGASKRYSLFARNRGAATDTRNGDRMKQKFCPKGDSNGC